MKKVFFLYRDKNYIAIIIYIFICQIYMKRSFTLILYIYIYILVIVGGDYVMMDEDKKVVSEVRNALGTTYILVGGVMYALYYLFFQNTIFGLIILLSEPIISALIIIKLKLSKIKARINNNNWPKVKSTTLCLLLLLTVFLGFQSYLTIIVHIIASVVIYLYLKP